MSVLVKSLLYIAAFGSLGGVLYLLNKQIKNKFNQYEHIIEEKDFEINKLNYINKQLIIDYSIDEEQFNNNIDQLNNNIDQLNNSIDQLNNKVDNVNDYNKILEQSIDNKTFLISQLETNLVEKQKENQIKLNNKDDQIKKMDGEIIILKDNCSNYEQLLLKKDNEIKKMDGEIIILKDNCSNYEQLLLKKDNEIKKMDSEIKKMDGEIIILKDNCSNYEQLLLKKDNEIKKMDGEIIILKDNCSNYEQLLLKKDNEIKLLSTKSTSSNNNNNNNANSSNNKSNIKLPPSKETPPLSTPFNKYGSNFNKMNSKNTVVYKNVSLKNEKKN